MEEFSLFVAGLVCIPVVIYDAWNIPVVDRYQVLVLYPLQLAEFPVELFYSHFSYPVSFAPQKVPAFHHQPDISIDDLHGHQILQPYSTG
jgi:hypothetical protein